MRPAHAAAAAPMAALVWSVWRARSHEISGTEERVFRTFNDGPDALAPVVWPVMQMGSLAAVYVAAGQRYRLAGRNEAAAIAVVGTAVWAGIKLVKPFVGRGRPADHLERVHVRGHPQTGLGYPSGHAAVSLTLALAASTTSAGRRMGLAAAAMTAASRMYVGAHLPLDVVGGAAAGWLVGNAAAGCTGRRSGR